MRKKLLATVVCLACVSALTLSSNAAYFLGGKLNKGIYNRTYYVGCSSSSYVNACTSAIADWMRSIANHEVRHAIGLAHNQTNQGVLMYQGYNVRTAIGPTGDEVRGAKALYN